MKDLTGSCRILHNEEPHISGLSCTCQTKEDEMRGIYNRKILCRKFVKEVFLNKKNTNRRGKKGA